jgi:DNA adenine methylase
LYSKAEYDRSVDILRHPAAGHNDLVRAWAYYVNIQQSFSNKLFAGWGRKIITTNSAETWQSGLNELPKLLEKLSITHIECTPALKCIDYWDSPQTLFYIDPPYPGAYQGHYGGYTADDWAELCIKLDSSEASYILSNYPQAIEPSSAQQRIEIKATMTASGAGKVNGDRSRKATAAELGNRERTEVLWVCDRSANARDDLKPVFRRLQQALNKPQQGDLFGDVA